MRTLPTIISTTLLIALAGGAHASGPAGVWSLPDAVTILDAEGDRPSVVIEGLFTVWTGDGPVGGAWGMQGYEDGAWGVMVYKCEADEKAMCLMQWGEILTATTTDGCVGWGNQDEAAGTVRDDGDTADPDAYPIDQGVISGVTPCGYLTALPPRDPPVEAGPEPMPEAIPDIQPPEEEPVETTPEPGPEPTPEPAAETTGDTGTTADTSPAGDTSVAADTGVPGDDTTEGGACAGGGLGLAPALGAVLALLTMIALRPRRRAFGRGR